MAERPVPGALPPGTAVEAPDPIARRLWAAVYVAVVLAPFAFMAAAPGPSGRSFGIELGAALGFAALSILVLQVVLPSRAQPFTAHFGIDTLLRFHRHIGVASIWLVVAHLVVLLIDDPSKIALLDPRIAPWRARAGVAALVCLFLLGGTSLWRRWLRLGYETWRGVHIVLGAGLIGFSFAHMVGVDHYLSLGAIWAGSIALMALAGWGISHLRLARPHASRRTPYVVTGVRRELGGAHTLRLRAAGHPGHPFRPGQFAWIKLGDSPFSLREHPFSYSSSAFRPHQPEFTIKALGDFTGGVGSIQLGTQVLVDGPHGSFHPAFPEGDFLLIAGGVGITPMRSFLRSFADAGDRRRVSLVYVTRTWEDATFRDELERLQERLPLKVHHALTRPHAGWPGHRGRLTEHLLRRAMADLNPPFNVFVCGSAAMVDDAEARLHRAGIPRHWIHTERFASA
ncbi:MAG TPA: ferric reductase-like transmembrane domain-containing protein [Actinomycetota bacterium]|nr:ferric reductase-like transmembrane domain-containing protein [Actinomycetota bacterium]